MENKFQEIASTCYWMKMAVPGYWRSSRNDVVLGVAPPQPSPNPQSRFGEGAVLATALFLPASRQALDMTVRQASIAHAFLYSRDVISHAAKFPGILVRIEDGIGSPRVTVTRLAD